jgi:ferredoxin
MKVIVNHDRCEGNAVCMSIAPEVFKVEDDDRAYVLIESPPAELEGKVREAARRCPRLAIEVQG